MNLIENLAAQMGELRKAGTFKEELVLQTAQGPRVKVGGREVLMLTSNNYLGFANHPRVREAQKEAVDRWGAGLGSVRFICGTQELHKELEAEIARFFGTEDTILYMTCWSANEGLFAARSEEHTSELQSRPHLVCRLLLEKKKKTPNPFLLWKNKKIKIA